MNKKGYTPAPRKPTPKPDTNDQGSVTGGYSPASPANERVITPTKKL